MGKLGVFKDIQKLHFLRFFSPKFYQVAYTDIIIWITSERSGPSLSQPWQHNQKSGKKESNLTWQIFRKQQYLKYSVLKVMGGILFILVLCFCLCFSFKDNKSEREEWENILWHAKWLWQWGHHTERVLFSLNSFNISDIKPLNYSGNPASKLLWKIYHFGSW